MFCICTYIWNSRVLKLKASFHFKLKRFHLIIIIAILVSIALTKRYLIMSLLCFKKKKNLLALHCFNDKIQTQSFGISESKQLSVSYPTPTFP